MKDEFTYRSTPDGSPPSGRKQTGTWKDISLSGADPKLIDEFDMDCQERGMTRFEFATNVLLAHPEHGGDAVRFYNIFHNVRKFKKLAEGVKKRDIFDEFSTADNDSSPEIS
tara:strand:- start:1975 stop:2310 length:336 start_codon:yes stop_codon:yes gene_type:complete